VKHKKKIIPECYNDILHKGKRFDLRDKNDGYKVGETITYMEYDGTLSGREIDVEIVYLSDYGLMDGDIMVGFEVSDDSIKDIELVELAWERKAKGSKIVTVTLDQLQDRLIIKE
jgi:hypothetical protein